MKNLWKYSGTYIWASGVLHVIVGLIACRKGWQGIVGDGIVNAVGADLGRSLAFWFMICGVFIITTGITLQHYIKVTQRPAPVFLGWWLLAFAVVACVVTPGSGGWLFLPQAWIIFAANRSSKK